MRKIDIEKYKENALKILNPIKTINKENNDYLFGYKRSDVRGMLPKYYLIFFLFSDLLDFKNFGRFEKIAWSFPIDYNGKIFLIEYRKFGVGIFIQDDKDQEDAKKIAKKISGAVSSIRPFFDFIAEQAVLKSEFNVVNKNGQLFERFNFLLKLYKLEFDKYIDSDKKTENIYGYLEIENNFRASNLKFNYKQRANWLAISCIEAFYSWTEHLFIHLAIICQKLYDGKKVSDLIGAEWKMKFNAAIPIGSSKEALQFYTELITVRTQLRNFVAHGAFGKNGNAFNFHSDTGTVPVLMNHNKQKNKFSLNGHLMFNEQEVIELIEEFIKFLWSGITGPAMIYTQKYKLTTILTYSVDGTYKNVCESKTIMTDFANMIMDEFDNAANMDW